MLLNGRNLPKNEILETDVCIVGGGAAGITLAKEFVDAHFKVILFESGGSKLKHQTWNTRTFSMGYLLLR